MGLFVIWNRGLFPLPFFTCINQVALGEPNKGARRKFSGIPPFLPCLWPVKRMEGCRESYDSAMPHRACALGGLPGAGYLCTENTEEGTSLEYPYAKRTERQEVLKEYGRLCALSGSAGGA